MKKLLFILFMGFVSCEPVPLTTEVIPKDQWVFVACEGKYGSNNGSIYMIN